MIERDLAPRLVAAAKAFPAVTLTGPRQSGKSTLCRALFPGHAYVNLEAPDTRDFAQNDPRGFLSGLRGGAILDEIQRVPELPSYLQPLMDEDPTPGRWILTGSQNFALLGSVSQSLAGRSAVLHLLPLSYPEVTRFDDPPRTPDGAMFTGGYPRIYDREIPPSDWLSAYVATYIERDVRTVSNVGDLTAFQRFVELCAGRTGQLINYSSLASDAGVSQPTAKAWLSILEASFLVFRLPPWSGNIGKRLTRMPKLHFYDTGLVCWLLGIREPEQLRAHPLRGAIFESWVVSEVVKARTNRGERGGVYFYRDQNGVEADLLVENAGRLRIVEVKAGQTLAGDVASTAFRVRSALGDRAAPRPVVVYAGDEGQTRSDIGVLAWPRAGEAGAGPA
ncbi:MAG: ATP-binding protein [Phycisphaeraceae bacterium]|nr:ATP-binding protein [Phycisphaeraceae bacterium]